MGITMSFKSVLTVRPFSHLLSAVCAVAISCAPAPDSSAAEPAVPEVWTPELAVIFGLQNSPDSRIALQRIEAAQAAWNRMSSQRLSKDLPKPAPRTGAL